jgi:hypothetical protein
MAEQIADKPELMKLWDADKNESDPAALPVRSYRSVWWKCDQGHSFQMKPRFMLKDSSCPKCALGTETFALAHPGLVQLWHPEKNGSLQPDALGAGHTDKVWWLCQAGHSFDRAPLQMAHDSSCPHCALQEESLAALFPRIAEEWHSERNSDLSPKQVDPDHMMSVWWRCPKGHEFQASVRKRTSGHGRCPVCYGNWSVDNIRTFVTALLDHIDALNPSETFALAMQAGVLKNKDSRAFIMALSTGRFPVSELEKFTEGKPSLVDKFAEREELTLEMLEEEPAKPKETDIDDPFALPDAPTDEPDLDDADIDVSGQVDLTGDIEKDTEPGLPVVKTRDALAALDNNLVANADAETVKFLIDSAGAKLWKHAYLDRNEAKAQAEEFEGDKYSTVVRNVFLAELEEAETLKLPDGYQFRPTPEHEICEPHLMQKHVAVSVQNKRRFGNWSGMGAGKTLSALLATRVVKSGLTVICCPNAVVGNWAQEIENAFAGCDVALKTWEPESQWRDDMGGAPRYLVMNYEQFQQPNSEQKLVRFVDTHVVDFVVIDEIHFAKQRSPTEMSKRKRLVQGLILEAGKKNADLCVLGMSGTPVINELQEGKSLVELIVGHRYDDLETKATVQNCMRLYQRLVTLGTRWMPNYSTQLDESNRPEIDCAPYLDEIKEVARGTVLDLERVLTKIRLPAILANIKPGEKVLIYTHYVDGIVDQLRDAVQAEGYQAGLFTGGQDDSSLMGFKGHKKHPETGLPCPHVDVLIASSRVSTGVDGLQHVCQKLIINCLPWTNAEYEQLRGRIWRQGNRFDKVEVVIPVTFAMVNGQRWSYCESKLHRLQFKKSIADAAVDGVVPEGNLRSPSEAQQDIMAWLTRLEAGDLESITRPEIKIPLSREPSDVARRVRRYGDFARMNKLWYQSSSVKTHKRLAANSEEWAHYHTEYRRLRKDWPIVPYKEEVKWLSKREGLVVGDFGCGEALVYAEVGDRHLVHSFDHVAVNKSVVACDISKVPLDNDALDVAIFSLSLMGTNITDYIREAHRCLRLDGWLHIWEPVSYFNDLEAFCDGLGRLGFDVMPPKKQGSFIQVRAAKNSDTPHPELQLHYRGK